MSQHPTLALTLALVVSSLVSCHAAQPAESSGVPATESAPPSASGSAAAPADGTAAPAGSAAAPADSAAAPSPSAAASVAPVASTASAGPTAAAPAAEKPKATPKEEAAHAPPPAKGEAKPADGYAGDDACQTTNFHYGALKGACHAGGRKAAKDFMRSIVKKAKAAGTDLSCTSCHVDMKGFQLKPNAVFDLKSWL